jgi:hypothetical protein
MHQGSTTRKVELKHDKAVANNFVHASRFKHKKSNNIFKTRSSAARKGHVITELKQVIVS